MIEDDVLGAIVVPYPGEPGPVHVFDPGPGGEPTYIPGPVAPPPTRPGGGTGGPQPPSPPAPSPRAPFGPTVSLDSDVESEAGLRMGADEWLEWELLADALERGDIAHSGAARPGELIGYPGQGTHSRTEGGGPGGYLWQDDDAVDVYLRPGSRVLACSPGRVSTRFGYGARDLSGGRYSGYRLHVEHDTGMVSFYQHNRSLVALRGQRVAGGELIAYSGVANGSPHLHFAVTPPFDVLAFWRRTFSLSGRQPVAPGATPATPAPLPPVAVRPTPKTVEEAWTVLERSRRVAPRFAREAVREARAALAKAVR